ncbi:hypothetical protein BG004_001721 [Podila humilis]|nr:hypothetical protein BG004_001721 [Podila humilis]
MASSQSSAAVVSEVKADKGCSSPMDLTHHHIDTNTDRDDDALVPSSSFHTTPPTRPTPMPAPPPIAEKDSSSPPKSYWDTAFYSSTPTPKPPPRLAPMPRSPPPALTIQTTPTQSKPMPSQQSNTNSHQASVNNNNSNSNSNSINSDNDNNTPIVAPGDRFGNGYLHYKSRYALAYQTHARSLSHSQAHSNHGKNIFTHAPDNYHHVAGRAPAAGSGSPALGTIMSNSTFSSNHSASKHPTLATAIAPATTATTATTVERGIGTRCNPDQIMVDFTNRPYSMLSHASPAAVRSSSSSENPLHQPQPQHQHQYRHNINNHNNNQQQQQEQQQRQQDGKPLLTPSSSQTSLFSNLPSPLPRTSHSNTTSLFLRDPHVVPSSSTFNSNSNSNSSRSSKNNNNNNDNNTQEGVGLGVGGGGGGGGGGDGGHLPSPLSSFSSSTTTTSTTTGHLHNHNHHHHHHRQPIGGEDISETSLFQQGDDRHAFSLPPSSCSSSATTTSMTTTSALVHDTLLPTNNYNRPAPSSASSSSTSQQQQQQQQQRKIYPGLKNTVGPYKLLHNIGQGSFSQVKMAIDTRTGDQVAIKVMSRAMVQSSDRLGISVRRESDLLKSIDHPNIIGFREVVESSLQTCIVLDYASGGELFEFVADKRPMASEADLQCIFAQIVDAVDYLHAHNIVHRDLKLEIYWSTYWCVYTNLGTGILFDLGSN